ncbi:MAG: hypothetical protein HGA31_05985 [Candidatus Moranbacteria bacterium]|nr:hypothetical protein [Candidatus Moranbacteria bacterium]
MRKPSTPYDIFVEKRETVTYILMASMAVYAVTLLALIFTEHVVAPIMYRVSAAFPTLMIFSCFGFILASWRNVPIIGDGRIDVSAYLVGAILIAVFPATLPLMVIARLSHLVTVDGVFVAILALSIATSLTGLGVMTSALWNPRKRMDEEI